MASSEREDWKVVQRKEVDIKGLPPAQREREEDRFIRDWDKSAGNWSGSGKHVTNAKHIHAELRVDTDIPLGIGAYGQVDAVSYRHVNLARKRIFSRRMNIEQLREEAHVMERLDHAHIVRLVGTYSIRRCELFLLLWPVAVCTLADFLDDLDHVRAGTGDGDDIAGRMRALALDVKGLGANAGATTAGAGHGGGCPLRFLQRIMGCLAQAVAHIHDSDVRHLDLKPTNILLNPDRVYIADFGIARGLDDGEGTMTVGGRGTKKWRAPETWDVENKWSMQAVDVYALGLVYVAITTVLYRSSYDGYDALLSEQPQARPQLLSRHLSCLSPLALACPVLLPHAASRPDAIATPRCVLELASRMLSPDPASRPRARDVDAELVLLGGIDQAYHGSCCRKSNAFVALRMDERHGAVCAQGRRLRADNEKLAREVEGLRRANESHAARADKDRRAMMARVADEVERRKALAERVAELEKIVGRRRAHGNAHGQASAAQVPGPGPHNAAISANGVVSGKVKVNGIGIGIGNGNATAHGPAKPASTPRPQAQPIQRIRSDPPPSQLRAPSDPAPARAPPLFTAPPPATLSASFSSVAARGATTPTPTPASSIPTKAPAPVKTSSSPSPSGYGLRSRGSTSRLPLPVTPRTSTPGSAGRDTADSTQASMASSIFSRHSQETLPTPTAGTPVVRLRQTTYNGDGGGSQTSTETDEQGSRGGQDEDEDDEDEEDDDDDDDDDDDGSKLWTTLPQRRTQEPALLRTWSSVVSSTPSSTARGPPDTARRPETPRRLPEQIQMDSLGEPCPVAPRYHPASPPSRASVTSASPLVSARSSPRLSRAEVASVGSAEDMSRRPPPTLSPMKSWAEVAGDAAGRTMGRARDPSPRGPSPERGDARSHEQNRPRTLAAPPSHQEHVQQAQVPGHNSAQPHANRRVVPAIPMRLASERAPMHVG